MVTVLSTKLGTQFGILVRNLVQGNAKKARRLAETVAQTTEAPEFAHQNLIEDMAQTQALVNGCVNLPSLFPGIGTLISFWLIGAENLLILDQSVTLVLTLRRLHGQADDLAADLDFTIRIIGEAYALSDETKAPTAQGITELYMTRELPQHFLGLGVNKILARLFPYRSRFRLIPFIGIATSAYDGYQTIVKVGQIALRHLQRS